MDTTRLKRICSMIIVLGAVGLSGCTRTVIVPAEEISLTTPTVITAVKLKAGQRVEFEGYGGGRYWHRFETVQGVSTAGTRRTLSLNDIDSVYYIDSGDSSEYCQSAAAFKEQQKLYRKDRIKGDIRAVCTFDECIEFNRDRGRIDSTNYTIVGIAKSGEPVNIPIDSVTSVKVRRLSTTNNILLIVGAAVIITTVIDISQNGWLQAEDN